MLVQHITAAQPSCCNCNPATLEFRPTTGQSLKMHVCIERFLLRIPCTFPPEVFAGCNLCYIHPVYHKLHQCCFTILAVNFWSTFHIAPGPTWKDPAFSKHTMISTTPHIHRHTWEAEQCVYVCAYM